MRTFWKPLAASLLCAYSIASQAGFKEEFTKKFPAAQGAQIERAFPGFYSVVKGSEIYFVRDDMSILIAGNVVDLKSNRSLTAALQAKAEDNRPKLDVAQLDLNDAIKFGQGSRRLFVFSDPDCPYCRTLEGSLSQLSDVTIYIFPFPLAQLHPNAPGVSEAIWCQADRAQAWRDYQGLAKLVSPDRLMSAWRDHLRQRGQPEQPLCANPIARNLALGEKWRIAGTPALVFEDGALIPGAVPAERIEAQLAKSHSALKGGKK
ncbi:thiol:disulfide interchange protein [Pandoraea cepalis]|uniref:Thiol:disulfide interchange protein n=1 Tax=Pandoraea cepalis TaxID=2508294 RepID=A0AAW7MGK2_9BURK|nr:DsbC family protein [Pandoraea cepalis]MDN4571857.1 thiol:disulfide interchange protein [Pandoraea cepalis]MDN4581311.1 thiol:disulfide interchange protein [Pandoraea cepalis]